jgi:hypothetical protein
MITIEEGLVYKLKNTNGVSSLVSTRIYPLKLPQTVTLPAITYQRISTPRVLTHDQASGGLALPRFQITVWAESPDSAKAVVDAVRTAIHGFRGNFGTGANIVSVGSCLAEDERIAYEAASQLYMSSIDFIIYHAE